MGTLLGSKLSEEHKRKISEAGKGRYPSEETRRKLSEALKGNTRCLGHHHTDETKKKMSAMHKGEKHPAYSLRGEKSWNWKGGKKYTKQGYVYIYNPKHPLATK